MTAQQQPKTRTAAEAATNIINAVVDDLGRYTETPTATRGLDNATAMSVCQLRAQLAIASSLLAIADAIQETSR